MKIYFIAIFIILIYIISTVIEDVIDVKIKNNKFKDLKAIVLNNDFNITKNIYLFQNIAWLVKDIRKKKKINKIKVSKQGYFIDYYLDKRPIEICENKNCFLFLAIENKKAVFLKKSKDSGSFLNFLHLKKDDNLTKDLMLKEVSGQEIVLYNRIVKKSKVIKMFDINITKYKKVRK